MGCQRIWYFKMVKKYRDWIGPVEIDIVMSLEGLSRKEVEEKYDIVWFDEMEDY